MVPRCPDIKKGNCTFQIDFYLIIFFIATRGFTTLFIRIKPNIQNQNKEIYLVLCLDIIMTKHTFTICSGCNVRYVRTIFGPFSLYKIHFPYSWPKYIVSPVPCPIFQCNTGHLRNGKFNIHRNVGFTLFTGQSKLVLSRQQILCTSTNTIIAGQFMLFVHTAYSWLQNCFQLSKMFLQPIH